MNLKFPGPSQCQGKKKILIIGKISSGMKKVSKVSNIKRFKNNLRYIHYTFSLCIHYVSLCIIKYETRCIITLNT